MVWTGHIETGNPSAPVIPFVREFKRPNKIRFEVREDRQKAVNVFDGASGWKMRTSTSGAPSLKPYTPVELRSAQEAEGIDGLLIDHQSKGIALALEGSDEVEGHKAYRLSATLPTGTTQHIWVDARTFLELKYDRGSHAPAGRAGTVSVFYRDYRTVDGLQVPTTIQTGRTGDKPFVEKMVIDSVTLNASLSDALFERPAAFERRHALPGLQSAAPAGSVAPNAAPPTIRPPDDASAAAPGGPQPR
jgi:outer membrane lipoprotein-sorting protein